MAREMDLQTRAAYGQIIRYVGEAIATAILIEQIARAGRSSDPRVRRVAGLAARGFLATRRPL